MIAFDVICFALNYTKLEINEEKTMWSCPNGKLESS